MTGERKTAEIGVHSLRGGDVIGDHTVIFAGAGERLELTHRATDRAVFARGALRAVQWVVREAPRLRHAGCLGPHLGTLAMITSIQGVLAESGLVRAIIELDGFGYEVNIPVTTAERLPPGMPVKLHTLVIYREDSQTLYGFATARTVTSSG